MDGRKDYVGKLELGELKDEKGGLEVLMLRVSML